MGVLSEASNIVKEEWKNTRSTWKAAILAGLVILAILAVVGISLWLVGKLVKSLTAGGLRNRDYTSPEQGGGKY